MQARGVSTVSRFGPSGVVSGLNIMAIRSVFSTPPQSVDLKVAGKSSTNASFVAQTAISHIDTAIKAVNTQRSDLGAVSYCLSHIVNNLTNISANLSIAKGDIEDADFAVNTSQLAKN